MPVHNADIAAIFEEIADLLEIQAENPFRIRAYRNAARTVAEFPEQFKVLFDRGEEPAKLPGIGADLAGKIHEIVSTGSCALLDKLHRQLPASVAELLKIPGLGPKRVKAIHEQLRVNQVDDLERAIRAGKLRSLPGFGIKTEESILNALNTRISRDRRFKLSVATQYAQSIVAHLRKIPGVREVIVAGSFRRMRETVGDLDLLVTAKPGTAVMAQFCGYDEVRNVIARGDTRASLMLKSGIQVDLRLVAPESYGAALHYFTGCKAHNIAVRKLGQARGLKINEYGVFRGSRRIAGDTEESVYRTVGLPYIEPELREGRGEIEAARSGMLPRLVSVTDLKGDLHAHSKATDGRNSIREMAVAAKEAGLSYLAITDHSRRLTVAHGLDPQRLARQLDEIARLNTELQNITILKGVEVDILEDGGLDLPESILRRLDLVVGAVHSAFELPRKKQTDRIVRAMMNPCFTILAHPGGRLIGSREPCDLDMTRIMREAKQRGCFLELNSQPERLDLQDIYCQMARDEGVLVSIDSDAHSVFEFSNLTFGIGQARRGWLEAKDVLNTRSLKELTPLLARTKQ